MNVVVDERLYANEQLLMPLVVGALAWPATLVVLVCTHIKQAGTRAGTQTHVCAICSIHNAHSNVSMFGLSDALCESGRGGEGWGGEDMSEGEGGRSGEVKRGKGWGREEMREREGGREGRI